MIPDVKDILTGPGTEKGLEDVIAGVVRTSAQLDVPEASLSLECPGAASDWLADLL